MIAEKDTFRTSEAAFAVNRTGKIVAWNKAAVKTFGYTRSKALGQNCWELLSGRDMFGNPFCCEGCPVRAATFNNELLNSFKIDFKTALNERKKFTVSALMIFNGSGNNSFVHLCRPALEVSEIATLEDAYLKSPHKPLTPRETEVLTLMHKGMTVAKIADALCISLPTVRNHIQHILLKLHVHSRFEAVAIGRKLNLI